MRDVLLRLRARLQRGYWGLWTHARVLRRDPLAPARHVVSAVRLKWLRHQGGIISVDGIRLRIDRRVSPTMVKVMWSGRHTKPERQLIESLLDERDVVMELGGGIGLVAIFCAKRIGSDRVFTYEANPALAPIMRENFALNGVSPHVEFSMLGPQEGTAPFYVARDFWVSSALAQARAHQCITVPVRSLNGEIERIRPTFLVIDIEGGEEEVFRYARLDSVRKIMLEVHPEILGQARADAVRGAIKAAGFSEEANEGKCWLYRRQTTLDGWVPRRESA